MKKIIFKKSLYLLFLTFIVAYSTCADGDFWDYYKSNFTPEPYIADETYLPLLLSENFFYTDYDNNHNNRFDKENVSDWALYLEKKIDTKTLTYFLANDSSAVDLSGINAFLKTKTANKFSKKWQSKIDLKNPKVTKFLSFLTLAKKIEKSTIVKDRWSYEKVVYPEKVEAKLIAEIGARYTSEKDVFLKNRYWFLSIKSIFYSDFSNQLSAFFNKTEKNQPKNTLYYRAIAYLAGVNYRNKNYAKSNYLYGIVFDKCPAMRTVATYSFHPQNQSDWQATLAMARNSEEKISVWAVAGYYHNEIEAVQKIYELNPKSPHLDYLMTRLVNIQEDKALNSFDKKEISFSVKDSLKNNAIDIVTKIAKESKTDKAFAWNCAAGYMHILAHNYNEADTFFESAQQNIPNDKKAVDQLRIFRLINNLCKTKKLTNQNEDQLAKELNWLYFEIEHYGALRFFNAEMWSKKYISNIYQTQNNKIMSELFSVNDKFYENDQHIEMMKSFFRKKNKSEIEKVGEKVYQHKLDDLILLQVIKATFRNKIDDAIKYIKESDSVQKYQFYSNPFNGKIKDCNDCEYRRKQNKIYTYLDVLTSIKTMQENIKNGTDVYNNALLLGNVFYSLSSFGNNHHFSLSNVYNPDFVGTSVIAKSYYEKAFTAASNDEQRAKCQYMLAKCERNQYYIDTPYENVWKVNFLAWNGFKMLKKNYAHTNYYKEVIRDCGYFDVYVNGPRQN